MSHSRVACLAAVLAACLLVSCISVQSTPDGARTVRTFGASTTTVAQDGTITTTSAGLSEGVAGTVVTLFTAARDAFLVFFGRAPVPPPSPSTD